MNLLIPLLAIGAFALISTQKAVPSTSPKANKGTLPGETPGRPAIILSEYGKGKVLLFSPNPLLGKTDAQHPELILNGISWLTNNSLKQGITFEEVFE